MKISVVGTREIAKVQGSANSFGGAPSDYHGYAVLPEMKLLRLPV
jgi:hypothetical protein